MDNRKKTNLFVISSQVPLKSLSESTDFRQGKTGQIVQRLTGCEMLVMGKEELNADESAMLKRNISNDGWVMITGHGREGGGFYSIYGETDQYKIDTQFLFDETLPVEAKKYSVKKYAELLTKHGNLQKGDHINLMLFVCQAGRENSDRRKTSFAEQLGKMLAEKGITSCIIANESNVARVSDPSIEEITMHNKKKEGSFKVAEPPFVFMTNKNGKTMKYQAPGDVVLTKDGVTQHAVSSCREKYNRSYLQDGEEYKKIDKLFDTLDVMMRMRCQSSDDYDLNRVGFKDFLRSREEVENSLTEDRSIPFAVSSTDKDLNSFRFSYWEGDRIKHLLVHLNQCDKIFDILDEKNLWIRPVMDAGWGYTNIDLDDSLTDSRTSAASLDSLKSDHLNTSQDAASPSTGRMGLFGSTTSAGASKENLLHDDEAENVNKKSKGPGGTN